MLEPKHKVAEWIGLVLNEEAVLASMDKDRGGLGAPEEVLPKNLWTTARLAGLAVDEPPSEE